LCTALTVFVSPWAFESKYPGVKIEAYRVSGSDMTTQLYEESKAKKYIADAVETTEGNLMFMRDAFLLRLIFRRILCPIRKTLRETRTVRVQSIVLSSWVPLLLLTNGWY